MQVSKCNFTVQRQHNMINDYVPVKIIFFIKGHRITITYTCFYLEILHPLQYMWHHSVKTYGMGKLSPRVRLLDETVTGTEPWIRPPHWWTQWGRDTSVCLTGWEEGTLWLNALKRKETLCTEKKSEAVSSSCTWLPQGECGPWCFVNRSWLLVHFTTLTETKRHSPAPSFSVAAR